LDALPVRRLTAKQIARRLTRFRIQSKTGEFPRGVCRIEILQIVIANTARGLKNWAKYQQLISDR